MTSAALGVGRGDRPPLSESGLGWRGTHIWRSAMWRRCGGVRAARDRRRRQRGGRVEGADSRLRWGCISPWPSPIGDPFVLEAGLLGLVGHHGGRSPRQTQWGLSNGAVFRERSRFMAGRTSFWRHGRPETSRTRPRRSPCRPGWSGPLGWPTDRARPRRGPGPPHVRRPWDWRAQRSPAGPPACTPGAGASPRTNGVAGAVAVEARPASSDRSGWSACRPHSTGVESMIQVSSSQSDVSRPGKQIAR